jgi:polysaccharide export outer membrane protein
VRGFGDGIAKTSTGRRAALIPAQLSVALLVAAASVSPAPALAGGRALTPMDVVTIRIVTAPDLDTTARVGPDGTIAFPYLGRIRAAGLTEDQLAERIERGLIARKILAGP